MKRAARVTRARPFFGAHHGPIKISNLNEFPFPSLSTDFISLLDFDPEDFKISRFQSPLGQNLEEV